MPSILYRSGRENARLDLASSLHMVNQRQERQSALGNGEVVAGGGRVMQRLLAHKTDVALI